MQASREVVNFITGAWRTQALYTAVRLGLPDHIEAGRTTDRELAESTGVGEDAIHRLMRLLVALKVFEVDARTGYRNTPMSTALLEGRPGSLRDMCLLYGEEFYSAWGQVYHAITTATSGFERVYGRTLISYLSRDEDAAGRFQNAMRSGNFFFDHVPEVFDFSTSPMVVDVGGGSGELLSAVLRATPQARGMLVDLAHMAPIARAHLAETVGLGRVEVVTQDIFESIPSGGDVYLLSRVLGDWDDAAGVRLLGNLRRAMTKSSRLLVLERVVSDGDCAPLAALWDLHLMVMNGGRHRTVDDFRSLFDQADLSLERVAELPMETSALIVTPRSESRDSCSWA